MRSTWRKNPATWSFPHYLLTFLDAFSSFEDREVPVHAKTDPVPYLPDWKGHLWILSHAFAVLAIHEAYVLYTGKNLNRLGAFLLYAAGYKLNAINLVHLFRRLAHVYGFFDGDKHQRDGVPDNGVGKTLVSLLSTTTFRPIMTVLLAYKTSETPRDMNLLWLAAEIGVYSILLDFYFYWYHRAMHDVDFLWTFHRTHHLTKHPISLLSAFADHEQELFDILVCPFLTWSTMKLMGFPLGFYDWWVCYEYVIFAEALGHSGLRIAGAPPSTLSWLMWLTGCELIIEDHDLHHRYGYRVSANYGKQTRLWDRIFGTCRDRIESKLIDFENPAEFPILFWPQLPPKILT
jgi:sterol desaturase/sphingolipid hydroxylase (fatty acid hydroxylase superfamily)